MLTIESRLRRDPEVIATALPDGDAVLLHLGSKTYYSLNRTAARIWALLDASRSLGEVSRELAREFEIPPLRAEASVLRLAASLDGERLVSRAEEPCG